MTFRRGATLPVSVTLGHADTCDIGPTAGNGFYKRWPDDLALLADAGLTDLRVTFDWARLQPKPGEFAGDWAEYYENVIGAASAVGLHVWATCLDDGLPKWFVNEGGLDNAEAITRWWPRWIERVADRFGDQVGGWIPFAIAPAELPTQVWTDTWRVLGGETPPVMLSVAATDLASRTSLPLDQLDIVGVAPSPFVDVDVDVDAPDSTSHTSSGDDGRDRDEDSARERDPDTATVGGQVSDDDLRVARERCVETLESAAELAGGQRLAVSSFGATHSDPGTRGQIMSAFVDACDSVEACSLALVDPAIDGVETTGGLFDDDRSVTPSLDVYLAGAPVAEDD